MNDLSIIRKQRLLTQEVLAKKMGIKQSTVSYWESNKATPNYSKMKLLASILKVDIQVILDCFTDEKEKKV